MFHGWTKLRHPLDDETPSPPDAVSHPSDDIANDAIALLNPSHAWFSFDRRGDGRKFSQSNLVSDSQAGHLNAAIQDPNLINPWGVAFSPTSPIWVNNNHTGTATVYNVDPKTNAVTALPLVVTIAPPQACPA